MEAAVSFILFLFLLSAFLLRSCIAFKGLEFFNYTQKINHFGVGGPYNDNSTFNQVYGVDNTEWAGPSKNAPIIVLFGGEKPLDAGPIGQVSLITQASQRLRALVVYIEHRFYGSSVPEGSIDAAFMSPLLRSYLSTEQALADYAEIILNVKADFVATHSPVIVVGGSYAGMLAAWFRLKYPHIAIGALASSAPILFFEIVAPENEVCSVVTRDFEHVNLACANIIRQSWGLIDEIGSAPGGLDVLKKTFNLCGSLNSTHELKDFLASVYLFAAQYNGHSICYPIVHYSGSSNPLEGVARGLSVINGNASCVPFGSTSGGAYGYNILDRNSLKAWQWQRCSELFSIFSCNYSNSMIPNGLFDDENQLVQHCLYKFQIVPRVTWVQTYYGGRDIKAGSNIIFSNGLMDPLSSYGILDDVSDTIVAIRTKQGSHCLDLNPARKDDPRWLIDQRRREIIIFKRWIRNGAPERSSRKETVLDLVKFVHKGVQVKLTGGRQGGSMSISYFVQFVLAIS